MANLIIMLTKHNNIKNLVIKLIKYKTFFYEPIYNLSLIKLEPLKFYIEKHLKTRFI